MYQAQERYGLVWVRLVDNGPQSLPEMNEWYSPDYLPVLPDSVDIKGGGGTPGRGISRREPLSFCTQGELWRA